MCRWFKSLLRYHRTPHSFHALRKGHWAKQVVEASRDLDLDAALSIWVA